MSGWNHALECTRLVSQWPEHSTHTGSSGAAHSLTRTAIAWSSRTIAGRASRDASSRVDRASCAADGGDRGKLVVSNDGSLGGVDVDAGQHRAETPRRRLTEAVLERRLRRRTIGAHQLVPEWPVGVIAGVLAELVVALMGFGALHDPF